MSSQISYKIDISIINKKDYLSIIFPSFENLTNFKYEIFGNNKFFLSGKIEKNSNNETRLLLDIPEDTIFLIKIVAFNKCKNNRDLFFKFINYDCRFNGDRNITMKILKKNKINSDITSSRLLSPDLNVLKSIEALNTNLVDISNSIPDSDSSDIEESSNHYNNESGNDNDNDSNNNNNQLNTDSGTDYDAEISSNS